MINNVSFAFLKAVKENNNVQWMHANRDLYILVRDRFFDFGKKLIAEVSKFDKHIEGLQVKDATFRFNKDIRFSRDKSPYKTNFWIILREEGKRGDGPGYYVHIQPHESFIGWWLYMPPSYLLQKVRSYISKHYKELQQIITTPAFKKTFGTLEGEALVKVPKGFNPDHPWGKLLKMKSWYVGHNITDKQAMSDDFLQHCVEVFKVMKPLNDFLNKAMR